MPSFSRTDPSFWSLSPKALQYTQVFAEAVDHRVASFVLGDDDDIEAPLALFMNLPPGWVLDRHSHDCHRFEVIIEGSMIVDDNIVLRAGDVGTSEPGESYGPHMAGPNGVLTLEIFSRQSGLHPDRDHALPADQRITALIDELRAGTIPPEEAAADPAIAAWAAEALAQQPELQQQVLLRGAATV
jgi:hypothetical protein